ncbi:MAG: aspartyl/glutamyl-tRNA amidotransferase subunit C [Candidatus Micrarchaeaceae archaeon]|nr:aspartyl/glutamyl-tRNA amidotransferase subunit C [Candidatus Marsarchaeota archaeon]
MQICRLILDNDQMVKIKKDTEDILNYFDKIEEVETTDLKEYYHPIEINQKLREDTEIKFNEINLMLENTKIYRFYVVGPKI